MSHHIENPAPGPDISKAEIRARGLQYRRDLDNKDRRSEAACARLCDLPVYATAETVLVYLHIRSELRTTSLVTDLRRDGRKIVIPFCVGSDLNLFRFTDPAELAVGTFGILEPLESLRGLPEKLASPEELDLLAVPGVAFDRRGGRVGHGRGYFDRLLRRIRPDAIALGLAFDCQVFDHVPMEPHDVPLEGLVTESATYFTQGGSP